MEKPKLQHAYLTDGNNRPLEMEATNEACPFCGMHSGGLLGVIRRDDRKEEIQCNKCDYQLTRTSGAPASTR